MVLLELWLPTRPVDATTTIGVAGVFQWLSACGIFGRARRVEHEEDIWREMMREQDGRSWQGEGGGLVVEER